jgi:hypothetical protein
MEQTSNTSSISWSCSLKIGAAIAFLITFAVVYAIYPGAF